MSRGGSDNTRALRLTSDNLRIAQFFPIDELHVLCMKPPRCVLFHPFQPRPSSFRGLEDGIVPVFPIQRSITIKNHSLRRKQVPMCAAFSLTEPRDRYSRKAWWISGGIAKGKVATLTGISVLSMYYLAGVGSARRHPVRGVSKEHTRFY